nr:glycosyltransferase [Salipaludibacillus agaradhaerens]
MTIIMATYNAERYLDNCLESIARQTYSNFKVHIIDDASKDQTLTILKKWLTKDRRFTLVKKHEKNIGLTKTLNELIKTCQTDYIARMDADDYMHADRLKQQIDFLNTHSTISVVGSWAQEVDEHNVTGKVRKAPINHHDIEKLMIKVNPLIHPTVTFRREALLQTEGYDERYRYGQDYALWFRLMAEGYRFENIPEKLLYYRLPSTHIEKRKLKFRLREAKIRWRGTKLMRYSLIKRMVSAGIPVIVGLMPTFLLKYALKLREKVDPRYQ